MPVIGAAVPAAIVQPGSNLDAVVRVGGGSGSLLATQTLILTCAHGVWPAVTPVTFNLQRAGTPVNIAINIPTNPVPGPNVLFPAAPLAFNPATDANDIAVVILRDPLPLVPGLPANLRLIAPFSPFTNGYPIVARGAFPQTFHMAGYGQIGTGPVGQIGAPPPNTKTLGGNQYDQTFPAAGAGSIAGRPADPNMLEFDFDDGTAANNIIGGLGLGTNNTLPPPPVGPPAPAPWLNESMPGTGDSGGPGLIGIIGNGSGPVGGAGNQLQIVGVESWGTGNGQYGTLGGQVLAATYNNPPAPGVPAGFIWTAQNNTPYGAVLDMRLQVLGAATDANGAALPQDPLTITVGRGTAAGVFQAGGPNLLIQVVDTAQPANFPYNGIYYNQPVNTAAGVPLITSFVLRGNDGGDKFVINGPLDVGPISILGGTGNDTLELDLTQGNPIGNNFHFDGSAGINKIKATGDWDYTLRNTDLTVHNLGTVTLANVTQAELIGGASDNNFTVSGWTGTGTIDGQGSVDTIISSNNADFTLADNLLTLAPGGTFNLIRIENAELTGGVGMNQFTVSGWTGTARLDGRGGNRDQVISVKDTNIRIDGLQMTCDDGGQFTLVRIEEGLLTGGPGGQTFYVGEAGFLTFLSIDGADGYDQVTVNGNYGFNGLNLQLLGAEYLEIFQGIVKLVNDSSVETFFMAGGQLTGPRQLTVTYSGLWSSGAFTDHGKLRILTDAVFEISGLDSKSMSDRFHFLNGGTVNWIGDSQIDADNVRFTNVGIFNLQGRARLIDPNRKSNFFNEGTLRKTISGETASFDGVDFENSGTVTIDEGYLRITRKYEQKSGSTTIAESAGLFKGEGSPVVIRRGILGGNGLIFGDVRNSGKLTPGGTPGSLSIAGQYHQLEQGQFEVELGNPTPGTGHDQLSASRVKLDGALLTVALQGFTGNRFVIIASGSPVEGTFQGLPEGAIFAVANRGFRITYKGGVSKNDVVLEKVKPILNPIGNKTVFAGCLLTFTATASDPDVPPNTLAYRLIGAPPGATIDPVTGVFKWTPTRQQSDATYTFTVQVKENAFPNWYDEETISVTVDTWGALQTNTASFAYVWGPGTPPLGVGSFQMLTGAGTGPGLGGKVFLGTAAYNGTFLGDLTNFTYSTYVTAAGTPNLAPYLNLYVDLNNDGVWNPAVDDLIVYEPVYQAVPNPVLQGTWQTWNAVAGKWWGVYNHAASNTPPTGSKTLFQIATAYPNARIISPFGSCNPGVLIVAGQSSGGIWANFNGNIDNVTIGVSGSSLNYNFEPASVFQTSSGPMMTGAGESSLPVASSGSAPSRTQGTIVNDDVAPLASPMLAAATMSTRSSSGEFVDQSVLAAWLERWSSPSPGQVGDTEPPPRHQRWKAAVNAVFSRLGDEDAGCRKDDLWRAWGHSFSPREIQGKLGRSGVKPDFVLVAKTYLQALDTLFASDDLFSEIDFGQK